MTLKQRNQTKPIARVEIPRNVVAIVLDYDIELSKFELNTFYVIPLGKLWNALLPSYC